MKRIELSQSRFAVVDDSDFDRVSQFKWCASYNGGKWYAKRGLTRDGVRTTQYLHSFILSNSVRIDHIDGDGLNCQRSNMRPCSQAENCRNQVVIRTHSTPFKGVSLYSNRGNYEAAIYQNGKKKRLGYFDTAEEAALAYDAAALSVYGDFARTNQQLGVI